MGASIAAALKKIVVAMLTDKKARKVVLGIILGAIVILLLPIAAIMAIFDGSMSIDVSRLQTIVVDNLSAQEQAKLQRVEDLMNEIEAAMLEAGFDGQRAKEAQVLFVLALYDFSEDDGFVDKLVGCFEVRQTDEQLISAVNTAFGTDISAEDFTNVMNAIRAAFIPTDGYFDPSTKNNIDLVMWAKHALAKKWGYVWGTYGQVLTKSELDAKIEQDPEHVGAYAEFIESHWLGGRTADCSGFIKGYGWFDPETHEIVYGTNGMVDLNSDGFYETATEKGSIETIPEIPGLAVYKEGHIGIYIGVCQVIHASSTTTGVVHAPLEDSGWTHWLKIPYITYIETGDTEQMYELYRKKIVPTEQPACSAPVIGIGENRRKEAVETTSSTAEPKPVNNNGGLEQ
ncbi:MAG: hypothetical protein IKZ82_08625 [Clostridia bacterium]|nr:hypothetical protein [Clostridia bacterium]